MKKALFTFLVMVIGLAPALAAAQAGGSGGAGSRWSRRGRRFGFRQ